MIEYLKAMRYKGISEIKLSELWHINVLCGKNNSGKTSILEALDSSKKNTFQVGKKIKPEDIEWLCELYSKHINKYQANHSFYEKWLSKCLNELIQINPIWYIEEIDAIVEDITSSWKKQNRGIPEIPTNYKTIFKPFFDKIANIYSTELIPPKRSLAYSCSIVSNSASNIDNGVIIANQIFSIKNKNPDSVEYKKYKKIYQKFQEITDYYFNIVLDNQLIQWECRGSRIPHPLGWG